MAPARNTRVPGVDKRPALFHNIIVAGEIEMVFLFLRDLRSGIIRPIERPWAPSRTVAARHTA